MNINSIIKSEKSDLGDVTISGNMDLFDDFGPKDGLDVDRSPTVESNDDERCYKASLKEMSKGKGFDEVMRIAKKRGINISANVKNALKEMEVAGNFVVSCKYAPKFKSRFANCVSYAIDCGCYKTTEEEVFDDGGNIDALFGSPSRVVQKHICQRTGLPVLFDYNDLTTDDKCMFYDRAIKLSPGCKIDKQLYLRKNGFDALKYLYDSLTKVINTTENAPVHNFNTIYDEKSDLPVTVINPEQSIDVDHNKAKYITKVELPEDLGNLSVITKDVNKINNFQVKYVNGVEVDVKGKQVKNFGIVDIDNVNDIDVDPEGAGLDDFSFGDIGDIDVGVDNLNIVEDFQIKKERKKDKPFKINPSKINL